MEPSEWLVFDHQVRYCNGFANRFLWDPSIPLAHDLLPGEPAVELLQDNPHHDPRAFEGRLPTADPGVGYNMSP
jgi:hypothetical protein